MKRTEFQPVFRYPLRGPTKTPAGSIKLLLPLAAVVVCAAIWIAAIQVAHVQRANLVAGALRENRNRAIAYEHYVTSVLDSADLAARQVAVMADGAATGSPTRFPAPPLADDAPFAGVDIIDAEGRVTWSNVGVRGRGAPAADVIRALKAAPGAPVLGDAARDAESGIPVIRLARAIASAGGGLRGAVIVKIPVDRLTRFYEGADFRPHDLISVIRLDGLTLARREGAVVSYGQNLAGKLVMQRQALEPNGSYIGPSSIDGVRRIFSHQRLNRYGLFVSVGLGTDDVLRPSYARAWIFYLTVTALTLALLLGALGFWLGLRRREAIIRRLAATNDRLREAQAIGKMGDWELDLTTSLLACSDQICRMHGRDPRDDVLRSDEAMAYHDPASREEIARTLRTAIISKRPGQCEVSATLAEGRIAHLRVRMSPIVDPDGRVRTVLGTEQDISTERRHEQLRAEVAHITRVEAVNVMAATIAHELAQPLTAAGNYLTAASYIAGQPKPSLNEQEQLAVLISQASRQIGLTGKIIARARDMISDHRSSEVASLDEIVGEAIALSKVAEPAAARTRIVAQLQPDTGHVAADRVQIQQVLLNLIRNAAQALGAVEDPQVIISSRRERAGMVMISVADNGAGLPAHADNLFTPFGATERNGLGLGLSICRTIVDSYGGRIWSETGPMGGAMICFTLPLDELALLYEVA